MITAVAGVLMRSSSSDDNGVKAMYKSASTYKSTSSDIDKTNTGVKLAKNGVVKVDSDSKEDEAEQQQQEQLQQQQPQLPQKQEQQQHNDENNGVSVPNSNTQDILNMTQTLIDNLKNTNVVEKQKGTTEHQYENKPIQVNGTNLNMIREKVSESETNAKNLLSEIKTSLNNEVSEKSAITSRKLVSESEKLLKDAEQFVKDADELVIEVRKIEPELVQFELDLIERARNHALIVKNIKLVAEKVEKLVAEKVEKLVAEKHNASIKLDSKNTDEHFKSVIGDNLDTIKKSIKYDKLNDFEFAPVMLTHLNTTTGGGLDSCPEYIDKSIQRINNPVEKTVFIDHAYIGITVENAIYYIFANLNDDVNDNIKTCIKNIKLSGYKLTYDKDKNTITLLKKRIGFNRPIFTQRIGTYERTIPKPSNLKYDFSRPDKDLIKYIATIGRELSFDKTRKSEFVDFLNSVINHFTKLSNNIDDKRLRQRILYVNDIYDSYIMFTSLDDWLKRKTDSLNILIEKYLSRKPTTCMQIYDVVNGIMKKCTIEVLETLLQVEAQKTHSVLSLTTAAYQPEIANTESKSSIPAASQDTNGLQASPRTNNILSSTTPVDVNDEDGEENVAAEVNDGSSNNNSVSSQSSSDSPPQLSSEPAPQVSSQSPSSVAVSPSHAASIPVSPRIVNKASAPSTSTPSSAPHVPSSASASSPVAPTSAIVASHNPSPAPSITDSSPHAPSYLTHDLKEEMYNIAAAAKKSAVEAAAAAKVAVVAALAKATVEAANAEDTEAANAEDTEAVAKAEEAVSKAKANVANVADAVTVANAVTARIATLVAKATEAVVTARIARIARIATLVAKVAATEAVVMATEAVAYLKNYKSIFNQQNIYTSNEVKTANFIIIHNENWKKYIFLCNILLIEVYAYILSSEAIPLIISIKQNFENFLTNQNDPTNIYTTDNELSNIIKSSLVSLNIPVIMNNNVLSSIVHSIESDLNILSEENDVIKTLLKTTSSGGQLNTINRIDTFDISRIAPLYAIKLLRIALISLAYKYKLHCLTWLAIDFLLVAAIALSASAYESHILIDYVLSTTLLLLTFYLWKEKQMFTVEQIRVLTVIIILLPLYIFE